MPIILDATCAKCREKIRPSEVTTAIKMFAGGEHVDVGQIYWVHDSTSSASCSGVKFGLPPYAEPDPTQPYWALWEKFEKLQITHKKLQARHDAILRPRVARKFKLRLNRK